MSGTKLGVHILALDYAWLLLLNPGLELFKICLISRTLQSFHFNSFLSLLILLIKLKIW